MKKASFRLGDIAFARSGDKGSSANIAVFARDESDYSLLCDRLTSKVVKNYFQPLGAGEVMRYEVPNLAALNFVLSGVLAEGGSRSLRIDAQGKTLGQAILELTI
ncbi:MAG: hypothetical protein ABJB32_05400 [Verrucomicrobiota bacterium]